MTGILEVMDRTGDTKHSWDSTKEDEVAAARAVFDSLRGKGYAFFKVKGAGERGTQIRIFDPEAERMIAAPAMVGG